MTQCLKIDVTSSLFYTLWDTLVNNASVERKASFFSKNTLRTKRVVVVCLKQETPKNKLRLAFGHVSSCFDDRQLSGPGFSKAD